MSVMKYSEKNKTKKRMHEKESKSKINRRFIYCNLFNFPIAFTAELIVQHYSKICLVFSGAVVLHSNLELLQMDFSLSLM